MIKIINLSNQGQHNCRIGHQICGGTAKHSVGTKLSEMVQMSLRFYDMFEKNNIVGTSYDRKFTWISSFVDY